MLLAPWSPYLLVSSTDFSLRTVWTQILSFNIANSLDLLCLVRLVYNFFFVWFDSLRPINNFSAMLGWVFLGSKRCLAQGHNTVTSRGPSVLRQALYHWATMLPRYSCLTHYLLHVVSSADNLCKQFWSRSGSTKCRAWSGSRLFDTLMVFLKEFFEKVDVEKNSRRQKVCKITQNNRIFLTCILNSLDHDKTAQCKSTFATKASKKTTLYWKLFCILGNFSFFFFVCWFFSKSAFSKILPGMPWECQTVWTTVRPDLGPNFLQSYQQMTLGGEELI